MMFQVYNRFDNDNRAPSAVILESEYEYVGDLEARDRKELTSKLRTMSDEESSLERTRPLRSGDVIVDEAGQGWILTPSTLWAQVEIIL
jgi:hypothetical protein